MRLMSLSLLTFPSTNPLFWGRVSPATTADLSCSIPVAKPKNVSVSPGDGEWWSERDQHAVARRELDCGFTALRESLMVATEATPPSDPGQGALHDPPSRQGPEAGWEELLPVHFLSLGYEHSADGAW